MAIILLTVLIRIVFIPLSIKALLSQRALSRLQPKIKELQEKHRDDKQALGRATMALYKEHNVNPFSGCLPLLIQLPVLIALYGALNSGFKEESMAALFSFVENPGAINKIAFSFLDLAQKRPILAILAGGLQWFQSRQAIKMQSPAAKNDQSSMASQMSRQMLYFFPIMVIIIAWNLPAGLTLYWVSATAFSILEQLYINRKYN